MQTVLVSLIALGALAFVVRRVVQAVKPASSQAACPSCQAGDACEGQTESPRPASTIT